MGSGSSRPEGPPPVRRSELHERGLRRQSGVGTSVHSQQQQQQQPPQSRRLRRHSANVADLLSSAQWPGPNEPPQHSRPASTRHRERLSRARTSLASSLPGIFSRHGASSLRSAVPRTPTPPLPRNNELPTPQDPDQDRPPPQLQPVPDLDLRFDLSNWNPGPSTPENRIPQVAERTGSTLADRISSLTPDRGFRNLTAPLRRRRSRSQMPEEHTLVLSQMLSFAATATAASLVGANPEAEISELQSASGGIDNEDGTFRGFLQALRDGRLAAALGRDTRPAGGEDDLEAAEQGSGSLDFFRMFRFGSTTAPRHRHGNSSRPSSRRSRGDTQSAPGDEPEQRMVPVLIVGIRSLNPETELGAENADDMPSFLEALANAPAAFNYGQGNPRAENLLRAQNGIQSRDRRRASMGALNLFSSNRDRAARSRDASPPYPEAASPAASETPPGPHPPPTTPYSPSLSTVSSGASTPTGRGANTMSAPPSGLSSRRESLIRRMTGAGTPLEPTAEESSSHSRTTRQRRRSASDTPRFGSGSSRRNGVLMEPQENRSWIIYVLGGSYPENHPILTTPSLFTDSPTYEDMLLLSSLLGPVKPPVAAAEDVALAPGLFKIQLRNGICTPISVGSDDVLPFQVNERCLICLCSYENGEEGRQLVRCGHTFHRECVDQWLTTGRNSCPLCRSQGVDEKKSDEPNADPSSSAVPQPATE